jgi:MFS superfamily sulfate permease-like transporter
VVFGLEARGVEVVGVLPQGFPRPQVPIVSLRELILLAGAAVGITIVSIGDTVSTSAGFAARNGYQMDSNRELVAIGSANVAAGLFQGFPISSSSSRTAVAEQSGARTQLTGLMAAGLVLLMLVAFPGLVRDLPMSVLSAVIIVASVRLFDARGLMRLWHLRRSEFAMALASMLGVFLVGVLEGIVIAVLLSILLVFERAWRPYSAVLGEPEGVRGFHDVSRYPGAAEEPGLIILRWDAPLFFANANIFRDRIRALVEERPDTFWVVVAAEPVTDVDVTASDMLIELDEELNAAGRHLVFAELKDPVKDRIVRYGLLETVSRHHFYATVHEAVDEFKLEYAARPAGVHGEPSPEGTPE